MSERLAEQALEISSLRAQLAANSTLMDSLEPDDGGMSLGESLGDAFGDDSAPPPPPPVTSPSTGPALTADMQAKLQKVESLEGENEELRQQLSSLRREVGALQAEADAAGAGEEEVQRLHDDLTRMASQADEAQQRYEKGVRDVKRMKGFLKEAKDVIEKQQLKIKEVSRDLICTTLFAYHALASVTFASLVHRSPSVIGSQAERKVAGAGQAVTSQQVGQLKQDVARLREARDQAEIQRREQVQRTNSELQMMTTAFYSQRENYTVELQSLKVSQKPSWLMGYQRATLREGRSGGTRAPPMPDAGGGEGGGPGLSPPPAGATRRAPPPGPPPVPEAIE